ncbi:MAG: hypothetical protein IH591_14590 [Bacteroidales bacterium]|nr:hypothetical protein [Bacteroidales bacterium]
MKKFLIKLFIFVILVLLIFAGLVLSSDCLIGKRKGQLLTLSDDINYVFAGNSAVECAVSDRMVKHSINIAESGEAYLYSYVKIKALAETNKHLKAVFLGYSFADLLLEKEVSWVFSDEVIIEKVQYYNYLLGPTERNLLFSNNPRAYTKGLIRSVVNNISSVLRAKPGPKYPGQLINFGGYKYLIRDKLKVDPGIDPDNDGPVQKSIQQEKYLTMISDLCRQNSIRLILFTTPKHKSYTENLNKNNLQLWLDVRNSLSADSLLELSTFSLPDSCFGDMSHLNYRGADLFSRYLNDLINPE